MKTKILPFLLLLPTIFIAGCGDSRTSLEFTFESQSVTYDGQSHSILVGGDIPEGVEITYTGNEQVNAGTYEIRAKIVDTTGLYKDIPEDEISATLTINKADLDTTDFFKSEQYTYDGSSHTLLIDNNYIPSGLTANFIGEHPSYSQPGIYEYSIEVTDSNEHKNYNIEESYTATLTIGKITLKEEDFSFENASFAFDGDSHYLTVKDNQGNALPNYYQVSYTNNGQAEEGTYQVTAHLGNNEEIFANKIDLQATLTITEQAIPTKVGDKYFFGRYPQTVVKDSDIRRELDQMTTTNERGYYELNGNEYAKVSAKWYGSNMGIGTPEMEGYGEYTVGQIMYFKVTPICWIVCEINNGQYLLRSKNALDCVDYYEGGARSGKYKSDYSISTVRAFLNGLDGTSYSVGDYSQKDTGFLPRAFNTDEAKKLVTMEIQNGSGTSFTGKTTNDKVTIVSKDELKDTTSALKYRYLTNKYQSYYESTMVESSQYVIARGAKYRKESGQYSLQVRTMTRTPYGDNGHYYLECPLVKISNGPTYSSNVASTYDACLPIITISL